MYLIFMNSYMDQVALSGIISLFWAARVQPYVLVKERETEIKTKRSDGREREKIGE